MTVDWEEIIVEGESLTVEFKSDRGPLSDNELLNAVVCMANGEGGWLLIGVEDDGTVTGLHRKHRTRPELLSAFIANCTVPPLSVETLFESFSVAGQDFPVAALHVPASTQPVATSDGRLLVRYLDSHGEPGCRPLYPHELGGWQADRGHFDLTDQVVPDANWEDLAPLEFARLRRLVEENRGDTALLELSNGEVAQALGLVRERNTTLVPTLAGLLLLGKEAALQRHLPTHEVAFQVLRGTDVTVNEFRRWPLLRVQEWLVQAVEVRNEEQELMVNGLRIGVPRRDRQAVREAMHNALIHRDYGMLGAIHVQLHDDHVLISNPGGFVTGVRLDNLLAVAPRPRNPLLSDAFKRIGLVERTGRGIDLIYRGQLRNGRPAPDYSRTTEVNVTVTLNSGPADLDFVQLSVQVRRRLDRSLRADDLVTLWEVWRQGEIDAETLQPLLQRDSAHAARALETLAQHNVLWRIDEATYRLAPALVEQAPARLEPEEAILAYVQEHGRIARREAVGFCGLTEKQAEYRLRKLVEAGQLELVGRGRGAHYVVAGEENSA
jgi:ATP-dependent DNA helicase RecG